MDCPSRPSVLVLKQTSRVSARHVISASRIYVTKSKSSRKADGTGVVSYRLVGAVWKRTRRPITIDPVPETLGPVGFDSIGALCLGKTGR